VNAGMGAVEGWGLRFGMGSAERRKQTAAERRRSFIIAHPQPPPDTSVHRYPGTVVISSAFRRLASCRDVTSQANPQNIPHYEDGAFWFLSRPIRSLEKKRLGMEGETADTEHKSSFQIVVVGTVISIDNIRKNRSTGQTAKN